MGIFEELAQLDGRSLQQQRAAAQGGPGLSSEQLAKLSHLIDQQVELGVQRALTKQAAAAQAAESHASAIYQRVVGAIDKISSIKALSWLAENGYITKKSHPTVIDQLPQLTKMSMEMEDEIAEAVRRGDAAEQDLATGLVEGAAADPEQAAALIAETTGEAISPEEVEAAAEELADMIEMAEEGDSEGVGSAEYQDKQSSYRAWAKVSHPIATAALLRMAENIVLLRRG